MKLFPANCFQGNEWLLRAPISLYMAVQGGLLLLLFCCNREVKIQTVQENNVPGISPDAPGKNKKNFYLALIGFILEIPTFLILLITNTVCKDGFGCGTNFFFSPLSHFLSLTGPLLFWVPAAIAIQRTRDLAKRNAKPPLYVLTLVLAYLSLIPTALAILTFLGILLFFIVLQFSHFTLF